jgi:transcriptional regulator with XRE-family HTH domain
VIQISGISKTSIALVFRLPIGQSLDLMESHEVLKTAFESPATSPKEIASEMGVSLSLIYKWAQSNTEGGSGSKNPLDRVAQLLKLTREPAIVEWLCQKGGGYFVRNPKSSCKQGFEVAPATHEIVQQFAGLLTVISQAALDNSITPEESAEIRIVWDKLKSYCEGFVRCCEEGDFEQVKMDLSKRGK